ncbi:Uncharacterized conserved protein, contains JmjC domain [Phaffia rhodozyma]|uniref:Uncharacterized conserved protein, contains JmjC domain n=1 Tax=Phaffia rhodozyma TaxID=264483 RepID=A0A0F7SFV1_PHARH|nr:Uncharacterized conserved protein, contains JmjC domain [Phaffia rhodozyma]
MRPSSINRSTQAVKKLLAPSASKLTEHLQASQPVLLQNIIDTWPALATWTIENNLGRLRSLAEGYNVPVEWSQPGRGFLDKGKKGKTMMPLDLFLDAFILKKIPRQGSDPANDPVFYLAQHDLLAQIPDLKDDAPGTFVDRYLDIDKKEFWRSNIWIGPKGTFTPIHKDPYHNLFCQILGSKTFHLYPPTTESAALYLSPFPQHQTSSIPVSSSHVPSEEYPLFEGARKREIEVVLKKGEVLFLPEGWWHSVEGEGEGEECAGGRISLNYWFR